MKHLLYGLPWGIFPVWVRRYGFSRYVASLCSRRVNFLLDLDEKLRPDCRASGQWGVYLRGAQCPEAWIPQWDDAA